MSQELTITADHIQRYLTENPDFFIGREDLLVSLRIPHQSGQAVSLVEKQLGILRERNTELRQRLNQLINYARDNDKLFSHTRQLILALFDCQTLEQALNLVYHSFEKDFEIETTQIILFDKHLFSQKNIAQTRTIHSESAQLVLGKYLKTRQAVSGLNAEERSFIFAERSQHVNSAAMATLAHGQLYGLIAIGHKDPSHYAADMNTLFLSYIAEVLSRVIHN